MPLVSTTLVVVDDAVPENPLEGTVIRVFSADGGTFTTQGTTDEDGELVLELEDATTYWVRFFKIGYAFASTLLIEVDSGGTSNIFDVVGENLTVLSPSTVPILCKASGYVCNPALQPKAGVVITFTLTGKPRVASGMVMVLQDLIVESDEDGWVEVELVRGGVYDCVVAGQDDTVNRVVVPDRSSVSLTELIWPYVVSLNYEYEGTPITDLTLEVGESIDLDAYILLSNGLRTPYDLDVTNEFRDVGDYVTLTISDAAVVVLTLIRGVLTVEAGEAGEADITAEAIGAYVTDRLPEPVSVLPTLHVIVTE